MSVPALDMTTGQREFATGQPALQHANPAVQSDTVISSRQDGFAKFCSSVQSIKPEVLTP